MISLICGVDVSSTRLDARIGASGAEASFANSVEGVAALAGFCRRHGVTLAVMEASGGYERAPHALLWAEAVPAAIVHPHAVRCFAQAMGVLEKTDRLDAGMIAAFAAARGIVAMAPPSEAQQRLRARVTRLNQITALETMQRNQRRLVTDDLVLAHFDQQLSLLRAQARELEQAIAALLGADPLWHTLNAAFRQIKGVASRTVARLMAELPEIGTLTGKAVSKLVGLAPLANDSGTHQGRRHVRGGRASLRSILFFVVTVVRRFDQDFERFAQKLLAAGKPTKVIRTALAHKLLIRLNAKARDARQAFALQA